MARLRRRVASLLGVIGLLRVGVADIVRTGDFIGAELDEGDRPGFRGAPVGLVVIVVGGQFVGVGRRDLADR